MWARRLYSVGAGQLPVMGSWAYGNEIPGSIKGVEYFYQLSDYQLLKKDSPPWGQ